MEYQMRHLSSVDLGPWYHFQFQPSSFRGSKGHGGITWGKGILGREDYDVPFHMIIPWGYWMTLTPKIFIILRCHLIKRGYLSGWDWMIHGINHVISHGVYLQWSIKIREIPHLELWYDMFFIWSHDWMLLWAKGFSLEVLAKPHPL